VRPPLWFQQVPERKTSKNRLHHRHRDRRLDSTIERLAVPDAPEDFIPT
jgi:hypothetical protein